MLSVDSRLPFWFWAMLLLDQIPPRTRKAAPAPLVLKVNPSSAPEVPSVRMALPGLLPLLIGTADPCSPVASSGVHLTAADITLSVSPACFGIRLLSWSSLLTL